jgi:hypothetical protein
MTGGQHTITIVYTKDGSVDSGTDKGYVLISKNNVDYSVGVVTSDITAICSNPNKFSLSSIGKVSNIDYSNIQFNSVSSTPTPDPEESYHRLNYLNYFLSTGIEGNERRIYLSNFANEFTLAGTCDFISVDGATTLLSGVPITVEGSGASKYIKIASSRLSSILGRTCYLRVKCRYDSTLPYIYLCYKVVVSSSHDLSTDNGHLGDCTLWLYDTNNDGTPIYMSNRSYSTVTLYPIINSYANGKTMNGYLYNTFAHGHLFTGNTSNYYSLSFMCDPFATADISELYCSTMFSLIHPSCTTIYDVFRYMGGSPGIEITVHQ